MTPQKYTFRRVSKNDPTYIHTGTLDVEPARNRTILLRDDRLDYFPTNVRTYPLVIVGTRIELLARASARVHVARIVNPDEPFVPETSKVFSYVSGMCIGRHAQYLLGAGKITAPEAVWMTVWEHIPYGLCVRPPDSLPKHTIEQFIWGDAGRMKWSRVGEEQTEANPPKTKTVWERFRLPFF